MRKALAQQPAVRRPRLRGLVVSPEAIRQARAEAGLSLAQVAGTEISRAAIHNIERGLTRPSKPTLELIARRTGKPISYFLLEAPGPGGEAREAAGADLEKLERMSLSGDFEGILALAEPLLAQGADPWSRSGLEYYAGLAETRLRHPERGLAHLRQAGELFTQLGDRWMAVECMDWEAEALSQQENPGALALAQEALQRCDELDPVPLPLKARVLGHIANMHIGQHNWNQAIPAYERALEAAGSLRDLGQMAQMYDGLSQAYHELGDGVRARHYSRKALALYGLMHNERAVAAAENNLGVMLLGQGKLDEAERYLRRAVARCEQIGYGDALTNIFQSLGQLALKRGHLDQATEFASRAMAAASDGSQRLTIAAVHQLQGGISAAANRPAQADEQFGQALAILRELGAIDRLRECHGAYAQILQDRGDYQRAAEQWKLAAIAAPPPQLESLNLV